jgi:hypothetical protein
MVLVDPPEPGERNEEDDECDNPAIAPSSPDPERDSDSSLLPDFEEMAQEAVSDLTATKKPHDTYLPISTAGVDGKEKTQHKSTILRIYSSRFSVAESKDRLKHVHGFPHHNEAAESDVQSDDVVPGEPMLATEDPAAVLVRSSGHVWLAVVLVAGIQSGPRHVQTLPTRMLNEPNVQLKVQLTSQ